MKVGTSVCLAVAVAFNAASCAAEGPPPPANQKEAAKLNIYRPEECEVRIEVYDPVLHFRYAEMDGDGPRPAWYEAYYHLQRIDKFEYKDWIAWFSPEFIERRGVTPEAFELAKKAYDKDRGSSGLSSALWSVYVTVGTRRFCFAIFDDYAYVDVAPMSSAETRGGLFIRTFEYLDGRWKHQVVASMGIAQLVPYTDRRALEAMLKSGGGIVPPKAGTAVPIEIPAK